MMLSRLCQLYLRKTQLVVESQTELGVVRARLQSETVLAVAADEDLAGEVWVGRRAGQVRGILAGELEGNGADGRCGLASTLLLADGEVGNVHVLVVGRSRSGLGRGSREGEEGEEVDEPHCEGGVACWCW